MTFHLSATFPGRSLCSPQILELHKICGSGIDFVSVAVNQIDIISTKLYIFSSPLLIVQRQGSPTWREGPGFDVRSGTSFDIHFFRKKQTDCTLVDRSRCSGLQINRIPLYNSKVVLRPTAIRLLFYGTACRRRTSSCTPFCPCKSSATSLRISARLSTIAVSWLQ